MHQKVVCLKLRFVEQRGILSYSATIEPKAKLFIEDIMQNKNFLALLTIGASILAACNSTGPTSSSGEASPAPQANQTSQTHEHDSHTATASPMPTVNRRIPAHFEFPPPLDSLKPTLDPSSFEDEKVRAAYQAAKEIPQTIAQLPCFCFCDESFGHKSLHSCYETDHSTGCSTCMDEALMARQLKHEGLTDEQIRTRIIATFQQ